MFLEFRKSVTNILEERISSPFYGTFMLSWLLWNWEIIYITIFIDQKYIPSKNKLDFIKILYNNSFFINSIYLLIAPLVSAIIFILVVPKLSNWLFKISLKYEKERMTLREQQTASERLTIQQSLAIRNEITEQAKKNLEQINQKDNEILNIKNINSELIQKQNQFTILYSEYGTKNKFTDVTRKVELILKNNTSFIINNENFGPDPKINEFKKLLIVYSIQNEIKVLFGKEHDNVSFKDKTNELQIIETEESKKIYDNLIDDKVLSSIDFIFPGIWKSEFKGNITGEEFFKIENNNQYLVNYDSKDKFEHVFDLLNIQINLETKKISFIKKAVSKNDKRDTINNTVNIIEIGKKYEGFEDNNRIKIVYTRIE